MTPHTNILLFLLGFFPPQKFSSPPLPPGQEKSKLNLIKFKTHGSEIQPAGRGGHAPRWRRSWLPCVELSMQEETRQDADFNPISRKRPRKEANTKLLWRCISIIVRGMIIYRDQASCNAQQCRLLKWLKQHLSVDLRVPSASLVALPVAPSSHTSDLLSRKMPRLCFVWYSHPCLRV